MGFAFLPLLQLRKVSPLRVLRRELGAPEASSGLVYGLAVLVLAGLFLWQAGSIKLGLAMLGGLIAGLLLFLGVHGQLFTLTDDAAACGHDHAVRVFFSDSQ